MDNFSHQYSQAGGYTVTAVAETGWGPYQGGFSASTYVQVDPACSSCDPFGGSAYAFGPNSVEQSSPYALFTDFSATGGDSLNGWCINWGDGTSDSGGADAPSFIHSFAGPGIYTVVAIATDAAGNSGFEASTEVTVTPLARNMTASGNSDTSEGSDYSLTLGFNDAGVAQPDSWLVNWGDGATTVVDGSSFTTVDHTFTSASDFTIEADAIVNGTTYSTTMPSVAVLAPSGPTGLTATPVSISEIDLAWTNVDPTLSVLVQALAGRPEQLDHAHPYPVVSRHEQLQRHRPRPRAWNGLRLRNLCGKRSGVYVVGRHRLFPRAARAR